MKPHAIEFKRIEKEWWLKDPNNSPEWQAVGPYSTKAEADEDRQGLMRFWKANPGLIWQPSPAVQQEVANQT